ncbi:putative transcription factor bZIP family [Helianthus annuus]|nr:putative transcription factor bZIP family [Helianthus annuus]
MTSTSTQFVTSRRMGIYDPLQQISMWEDAFGSNVSPIMSNNIMMPEVDARLTNKTCRIMLCDHRLWDAISVLDFPSIFILKCIKITLVSSHNLLKAACPAQAVIYLIPLLQRRLAQNREAARKSRLRKKAYVQQLESGRVKLAQLEQELERARRQGVYGGLMNRGNGLLSSNVVNSGIATFEMEYELWVSEQRKKDDELRKVLLTHTSEIELKLFVDSGLNHYYDLFRMKADAAKADVFYLMNGLWRTPVERFFQWIGGFRPSELIYILMPQIELTDTQLMKVRSLRQSCEQAEEALNQGMAKLQQTLAQSITIDIMGPASYNTQMNCAMERLEALEIFLIQADHLRKQTLEQMNLILSLQQAANALLALGEYLQRLRVLSSIWSARPRGPTNLIP